MYDNVVGLMELPIEEQERLKEERVRLAVRVRQVEDDMIEQFVRMGEVSSVDVGQIKAQASSLCLTKGICLQLETGANLGTLKADKLLLERAIMNVISNALDHSPPQGTIYVTVQKTDCFLHISITDEGGGFTPEALHHAQEQFFMGDKSRTSNMHFGMGLYITSSIIKQHGGQLVLSNSKKTGGAQVIIKIPY